MRSILRNSLCLSVLACLLVATSVSWGRALVKETPTPDSVRLAQPVLSGLPLIFWKDGGLIISEVPGVSTEESLAVSERLNRLHAATSFERMWRGFVHDVSQAASLIQPTEEQALSNFNLQILPSILFRHPDLVLALQTGDVAIDSDPPETPQGPTICVRRTYGQAVMKCCGTIFGQCVFYCQADCKTDEPDTTCSVEKVIPCPLIGPFEVEQ